MVIVQIRYVYGYTQESGQVDQYNRGELFFSKKVDDSFSRRPQNTRYKTT